MHNSVPSPPFFATNCQKKVCQSVLPIHAVNFTGEAPTDRNDIVWCCLRMELSSILLWNLALSSILRPALHTILSR